MTGHPSVSVVIPTAGLARRRMLETCLRSIHRAVLPGDDVEIVVVLDGGDPGDYDALHRLDRPVRVLAQPHAGPAAARNLGWRSSHGEVVAFLDDDTAVGDEWLADLRRHFAGDPSLAGLGGRVEPITPTNVVSRMMTDMGHLQHRRGPHGWRLITANAAVRREVLEDVGGFDERFPTAAGEDFDLFDRIGRAGHRLVGVRDTVVYHRHPTTVRAMLRTANRYATAPRVMLDEPTPAKAPPWEGMPFPRGALVHGRAVVKARYRQASRVVVGAVAARVRRRRVVANLERLLFAVPIVPRVGQFFETARAAEGQPSRRIAAGEAVLEVLWRVEFARLRPRPLEDASSD